MDICLLFINKTKNQHSPVECRYNIVKQNIVLF